MFFEPHSGPFPSSFMSQCENESSCETILIDDLLYANQTNFNERTFAQGLALKQRQKANLLKISSSLSNLAS